MMTITEYLELDTAPFSGYDSMETYGEPWDTFIKSEVDVDGNGCSRCENGCGGDIYDTFPDEGHRMAFRWRYMALIVVDGTIQIICEDCATALLPPIERTP